MGTTPLPTRNHHGFTLIELLVVVALVAVFALIGAPSYEHLTQENAIKTGANDLVAQLLMTRSDAIETGLPVYLCNKVSGSRLACSNGSNWSDGWLEYKTVYSRGGQQLSSGHPPSWSHASDADSATTSTPAISYAMVRVGGTTSDHLTIQQSGSCNPIKFTRFGVATGCSQSSNIVSTFSVCYANQSSHDGIRVNVYFNGRVTETGNRNCPSS